MRSKIFHRAFEVLRIAQQFPRVLPRNGRLQPAGKARDLLLQRFRLDPVQVRRNDAVLLVLFDIEIGVTHGGQLRQMRNANHLPAARDVRDLLCDDLRHRATDACVDLVKDHRVDWLIFRDDVFDSQHDARHLPAGGNLGERSGRGNKNR